MYLPWIGQFNQAFLSDIYVFLNDVQFARGFINRVQVSTKEGQAWLTVPTYGSKRARLTDMHVLDSEQWWPLHRIRLQRAVSSNAYKSDAMNAIEEVDEIISFGSYGSLADLNERLFTHFCKKLLGLDCPVFKYSSDVKVTASGSSRILEICKIYEAKTYITGHGARAYLNIDDFRKNNISVKIMNYKFTNTVINFTPFVNCLEAVSHLGYRRFREALKSTLEVAIEFRP